MRNHRLGLPLALSCVMAGGATAACLPDAPEAKAITSQASTERAATLSVFSGTLVQMDAYAPKALKRIKTVCTVATLKRGADAYVISGTADAAMPRIATSSDRNAPLLFLMTVPDMTARRASQAQPAPPVGYGLMSRDDKTALLYRAYDAVPNDVQLAGDIAAALEGRVPPVFRADLATHQLQITTAADAGTVKDRPPPPAAPR